MLLHLRGVQPSVGVIGPQAFGLHVVTGHRHGAPEMEVGVNVVGGQRPAQVGDGFTQEAVDGLGCAWSVVADDTTFAEGKEG